MKEGGPKDIYLLFLKQNQSKTMIPLLDLDKEILGFLCFHAPCNHPPTKYDDMGDKEITKLHKRWLIVLGQLCSRILEIRERHQQSVMMFNSLYERVASLEEMAEFGEMSADITHEIRQYFQRLFNIADQMQSDIDPSGPEGNLLDLIEEIFNEASAGSDRLTTLYELFKSIPERGKGAVSVEEAIAESIKQSAKNIVEANVACDCQFAINLPPLPMALAHALLVFPNLIRNACDAILEARKTSGKIEINTAWERPKLVVTVKDNGGGIAPENLPRLFQIGFTTKRKTQGMGMGLSLVQRVVSDHNGAIWAESTLGVGTTFHVEFLLKTDSEGIA
jgi:signal transduction histidine kinase